MPIESHQVAPRLPLAGLRVLDLTRLLPGGYATQILADFGADVIKVEETTIGDPIRWSAPFVDGKSLYFLALNRNKRSLALDLKAPEGRAAFLRLVTTVDVVVESFRPGVMERLGLGPMMLRERFPRLIYCAITGYGQDGPACLRAGHDLNYLGYAGMLYFNRTRADVPPTLPPTQIADLAAGALPAVIGILTALAGRSISGQGDIVDVAMLDGALALQPLLIMQALLTENNPLPAESPLHGGLPAYGIYATSDGQYITLAALEPKFWERFCTLVERPDLIAQHFVTDVAQREVVQNAVAAIFAQRTRAAWLALLADEDACVGPVNDLQEALADPQARAREVVRSANLGTPAFGQALARTPRLAAIPPPPNMPPPTLGEHSAQILQEAGLTEKEIAALIQDGIVAGPM